MKSIAITYGNENWIIHTDNETIVNYFYEYRTSFVIEKGNDASIATIEINIDKVDGEYQAGVIEPQCHCKNQKYFMFHQGEYDGYYDTSSHHGKFIIAPMPEKNNYGYSYELAIENVLRMITIVELPQHDKLLVHSSSVCINDAMYVFPGPSEVGKTSLAQMLEPSSLTSDVTIIGMKNDKNTIWAWPTFFDYYPHKKRTPQGYPLAGICFLQRDMEKVQKLSKSEALQKLLKNTVHVPDILEERHLSVAQKIITNTAMLTLISFNLEKYSHIPNKWVAKFLRM